LESEGFNVKLAHARDVELIAKSRKKTDERDSDILADLLRTGFFPEAYVPEKSVRELRELTRALDVIVKEATAVKNRVHRLLERAWIENVPDVSDLFGLKGRAFLETVDLGRAHRALMDTHLRLLDDLTRERDAIETEIARTVQEDEDVHLLLTIDGVSVTSAATLKAEIADAQRFPNRYAIRSNFGLAVTVRDSADTQRRGHITKQGSGLVRKVLSQCARPFTRTNPRVKKRFDTISKTRGGKIAHVATAVDLLDVVYQMLKNREPYRLARATLVQQKLGRLERLAGAPKTLNVA